MSENYSHLRVEGEPIVEVLKLIDSSKSYFDGKVILVTGGARGIGKELVIGFASLGAIVYFIDKRESEGNSVVREARSLGFDINFIHQDIAHSMELISAVNGISKNGNSIDILINNAVDFLVKDVTSVSVEEWEYSHQVNTTAPLILSQQVLPKMIKNKFGVIVNLIAVEGMPYATSMSSSKASLRSLTLSLSSEIIENADITIFGYAPGLVDTPLFFEHFPKYCERKGLDLADYIENIIENPGYDGLMPASHSAAALIWHIANGNENHGLIRTPFRPLNSSGIITIQNTDDYSKPESGNQNPARQYIIELDNYQNEIENKIRIRTEELQLEKFKTQTLLTSIKDQNKGILDSINYAKRIQNAMQTSDTDRLNLFPDSFVFYRPKDILSGDFFRVDKVRENNGNKLTSFIVADCTGHGVPGATLAMLCNSILKHSLSIHKISSPGEALDYAKDQLSTFFKSSGSKMIDDGMDVAFCVYDHSSKVLHFSGANSNCVVVRGDELTILKGDRKHVGHQESEHPFTTHAFQLEKNDCVYLSTDGYVDQFGGPQSKKMMRKRYFELLQNNSEYSMNQQKEVVQNFFDEWKGEMEQTDDVCVMGIRIT